MNELTFEVLGKVRASLPKIEAFKGSVVRPEYAERLRREVPCRPYIGNLWGIEVHEKPGQLADCWLIGDREILQKYLSGEITEAELVTVAGGTVIRE